MKKFLLIIFLFSAFLCLPVLGANPQATVNLANPLSTDFDNPAVLIGFIIKAILGIIGGVTLVMMVYGGFQWLTAAGNEEKIKNGTQTMLWAGIGLVLVFSSYVLAQTVMNIISGKV